MFMFLILPITLLSVVLAAVGGDVIVGNYTHQCGPNGCETTPTAALLHELEVSCPKGTYLIQTESTNPYHNTCFDCPWRRREVGSTEYLCACPIVTLPNGTCGEYDDCMNRVEGRVCESESEPRYRLKRWRFIVVPTDYACRCGGESEEGCDCTIQADRHVLVEA